jgi:glycosyltransferase involved in cell wall biosynthesis
MRDDDAKERVCHRLSIDPELGIVVLATQTHREFIYDQNRRLLGMVFDVAREFPRMKLVVKLHPAEEPTLHRRIASEKGLLDDIVLVKDVNLFDLLRASELLITSSSTVALEGILFDKPVVAVNVAGARDVVPLGGSGAAVIVSDATQLADAIRSVLTNDTVRSRLQEGRSRFIADYLHPLDGKAARRVVDLAVDMADAHVGEGARNAQREPDTPQD